MEYNNHTYEVIEKSEDASQTLIEKSNIKARFTLADHERSIADMEKTLKELNAKFNHEKLMKENIQHHHPFVLDLTPEQKHVVYQYLEACEVVRQYEPKIKEFEEALEADKKEVEVVRTFLQNE